MCGIVGFTGTQQAAPILLNGLSKLEYRGYDSAGIAVRDGEHLAQVVKAKGRLSNLIEKTDEGKALIGTCGIGHTRWATHGEPSQINAHPHVSGNCTRSGSGEVESEVVGVHNGIIENYTELKEKLLKHGYTFYSQTDTEVVIKLVDYYYKKYNLGPIDAIAKTMVRVRGSYALELMFKDYPGEIWVARKDSPMIIGVTDGETYVASDVPATYPRTDSQYVTEDMKETVETLADGMTDFLPFLKSEQSGGSAERVINNAKVSDHHAILPTKEAVEKGMGGLSDGKKNLLMLIGQQLVQATGEDYLYEQTEISVQCKEHEFAAKGKLPVQMGFKEVEEAFRKYCVKDKKSDEPDNKTELPEGYEEGMILASVKAEKSTHYTSPPKMFTEDTLLAAMETAGNKEFDSETEKKGLGTPATRANIIEKLVSSGYAERKGKQILPTVAGCELIHVMPENLKSASLTAEWENQLLMMEKGKIQDDEFMDGIVSMITEILSICRAIPEEERNRFQTAREVIGKCPVCGSDVYEGKTNYYCSDRSCPFALWKSNRFLESMKKSMDKKMAVELLKKGRTHVKGLYSKKKDSKFDADLVLGVEDGKARFSLEFPKKKTNSNKKKK